MAKRPTKQGRQRSAKPRKSSQEIKKQDGMSTPVRVILIGAAIIMALSTVLGSLSSIFGSGSQTGQSISSVEDVDKMFSSTADSYLASYESDPQNIDTINSLASTYMNWAQMSSMFATNDEAKLHTNELYASAIEYYDKSLAIEDSADVRSSRSLALLYSGEGSAAQSAMQEAVEAFPEDASAWANYGMILENRGSSDEARSAYEKAIELDTSEEARVKSYAEGRLEAMNKQAEVDAVNKANGTGVNGLTETLNQQSGAGF